MKKILWSERGFALLNVVFLTLITSFAAMILLNAAPRIRNSQTTLRTIALNLANEQFAYLESRAAAGETISGSYPFLGNPDDLTNENPNTGGTINFIVETHITGNIAEITVKWQVDNKNFEFAVERTIGIAP